MFKFKTISGSSVLCQKSDTASFFRQEHLFAGACFLLLLAVSIPCLFNGYQAFLHAKLPLMIVYAILYVMITSLFFYKKAPFRIRIWSVVLVSIFSGLLPHFSDQPWYEARGLFRDVNATIIIVLIVLTTALDSSIRQGDQVRALRDENQNLKDEMASIRRFKEIGHLSRRLAHDLNSILSGIATYPDVLLMDTMLDTNTRKGLMMIRDTGQRAADMVSDFLTILTGITAEKEPVDLNLLIDRFFRTPEFEILNTTFPEISIDRQLEPGLLPVNASYGHMEKAVRHLLWVACSLLGKSDGQGQVMIETSNKTLDKITGGEKPAPSGEYTSLRLNIDGVRLAAEHEIRLFEPFYIKAVTENEGTGLEMTVAWNTVQDHNGLIQVTSDQSGICFDLLMPSLRIPIDR